MCMGEFPDVPYGICCKVYKATKCCIGQTGWVSVGTITVSLRKHLGAKASQIAAGSFVQRSESLWDHQGRHWRLGGATRVGARMHAFFRLGAFVCFCGMRGCASLSCSERRVPTELVPLSQPPLPRRRGILFNLGSSRRLRHNGGGRQGFLHRGARILAHLLIQTLQDASLSSLSWVLLHRLLSFPAELRKNALFNVDLLLYSADQTLAGSRDDRGAAVRNQYPKAVRC